MRPRQRKLLIGVIVLLVLAGPLATTVMYTVDEREVAVILQFGQPVASRVEPGLYFKAPFIQEVRRLPKTYQFWEGAGPNEKLIDLPTADGKKIEVTAWAIWRITDPVDFVRTMVTVEKAEGRVQDFVRSATRDAITRHDLSEVVRSTNRDLTYSFVLEQIEQSLSPVVDAPGDEPEMETPIQQPGVSQRIRVGREKIVAEIKDQAQSRLSQNDESTGVGRGIELVDVGISRIEFVAQVREEAFNRLIAFMESIASRYTNEGERRKQEILNRTQAEVERIQGEGAEQANILRGDVDAEIIEAYAVAIQEAGEFYQFLRTLEVYTKAVDAKTRLILTTDSDLLRLLKELPDAPAP